MKNIVFLFSCSKYDATIPEKEFKKEYEYIVKQKYETILCNINKLKQKRSVSIEKSTTKKWIIYRGFPLSHSEYQDLYAQLREANYIMINTPEEYANLTFIPNWYEKISDLTPQVYYTDKECSKREILYYLSLFDGSAIVKDYVKSRKSEWNEACYIKDVNNIRNSMEVINNFITRQGEDLSGGIVLRQFVDLKPIKFDEEKQMPLSEEYRVFVYNKKVFVTLDYWRGREIKDISEFEDIVDVCISRLECSFYSIDIAKTKEGKYIVVEVGDGQGSSIKSLNEEIFYDRFLEAL